MLFGFICTYMVPAKAINAESNTMHFQQFSFIPIILNFEAKTLINMCHHKVMAHAKSISLVAAGHDAHGKPAHIFCKLPHSACNGHGRAYCTLQHIPGTLPRKSPETCAKSHYLLRAAWLLKNRFLRNPGPIRCNAP